MATYCDGKTEAKVGDVVRCAIADCNCGNSDVIEAISGSNVRRTGCSNFVESNSFELVSRADSPAKAEPLVKWPEEKFLTWPDLFERETFIFDSHDKNSQTICIRTVGGWAEWMSARPALPRWSAEQTDQDKVPVRRIQMDKKPQFIGVSTII